MITVALQGGLGNQMFQYAFGLTTAIRFNTKLVLSTARLKNDRIRQYNLGLFSGVKEQITEDLPFSRGVHEKGLPYNQGIVDSLQNNDTLFGYWQSEKYFLPVEQAIRRRFLSADEWSPMASDIAQKIFQAGYRSTFVGIRRADYLTKLDYHGVLDGDYYQEALNIIAHRIDARPEVFVFSDDPAWCRENLPEHWHILDPNPTTKLKLGREDIDLGLMSFCHNAVIANSSFHWWGAWLGDKKNVIAPKQWFTAAYEDSRDIVPERWTRI